MGEGGESIFQKEKKKVSCCKTIDEVPKTARHLDNRITDEGQRIMFNTVV